MANHIYVFHILHEGKNRVEFIRGETEEVARTQLPEGCTINRVEVR